MQKSCKSLIFKIIAVLVLGFGTEAKAQKTLMWLVDWYQSGNVDTITKINSVSIPHNNGTTGYFYGLADQKLVLSKAYAAPIPVNTDVRNDTLPDSLKVPAELYRNWYSLSNFNTGNYAEGRIRIYLSYSGEKHLQLLSRPDPKVQVDVYPKGEGQTDQLEAKQIDGCIDGLNGDSVWFWTGATTLAGINSNATAASIKCLDHNPFFRNVGTVHLLNPWPGKQVYVQLGARWYPMYQDSGRAGWISTGLWLDPRDTTHFQVRFANGDPSTGATVQYMDAGGLGGGISGALFNLDSLTGKHAYVIPPTTTTKPTVVSKAPAVKMVLMIHRPAWGASAVRVVWKGSDAKFIATATEYCNWFAYPLYEGAVPSNIVLRHPNTDTIFGSKGLEVAPAIMSTYANWIDLTPALAMGSRVWAETEDNKKVVFLPDANKPVLKMCDEKILAFSAWDFTKSGAQAYYPFSENYDCGNKAAGLQTKKLVLDNLNADGFPVWNSAPTRTAQTNCNIRSAADGPQNWFDTLVVGGTQLNAFTCVPLGLKLDSKDGYYKYQEMSTFFPLDTFKTIKVGGASIPNPFNEALTGSAHNYGFCMHAKASFEYVPGLQFKFSGDDDVWVFIDKKLALDLGGTHGTATGEIKLDKLGLGEGKSYQFDMFFCERQRTGSSINIQTTMNLVPTVTVQFDTLKSTSSVQDIVTRVLTEQLDPGVCPENGKGLVSDRHPGRSTYTLVMPDGSEVGLDSTVALGYRGLTISGLDGIPNSHISIDTAEMKKSAKLVQSGTYVIRIEMGSESRAVSFSKLSKVVEVMGTLFDANGDGRGDSVVFKAREGAQAFSRILGGVVRWADFAGKADSSTLLASAITSLPGDSEAIGKVLLPFRTSCPPTGCTGDMGAIFTLNLGDSLRNPLVTLADGMAPVADSAWLVYDTTGMAKDTLYVIASEPLVAYAGLLPAGDSAYVLAGRSVSPRPIAGAAILSGTLLKIAFDPASNPLQPGDSVRLGGYSGDVLGNAPRERSRWVYLKADPVAKSWMLDVNGDGYPDSIGVAAKGSLASAVSAKVNWKTTTGTDTAFTVATPGGVTTGVKLPAGILKNATYCSGCNLVLDMGAGLTKQFALLDSVAPVALGAKLRYGITADTLLVTVSEPIELGSAPALEGVVATKLAGSSDRAGTLVVGTGSVTTVLQVVVAPGAIEQDSVRLRAWVLGNLKKAVGQYSPFVKIEYGPQPIRVAVWDNNGDGYVDSVSYRLTRSAAGAPAVSAFGLVWGSASAAVPATLPKAADGLSWSGDFGPVARWGTSASANDHGWLAIGADVSSYDAVVEDSVAPVAYKASLVFGLEATDPDTLRIEGSESIKLLASGIYAMLGKDSGSALSSLNATSGTLVPSTTELVLAVPPGAIADSIAWVRFGSAVTDNGGKAVGVSSGWVKLALKPSGRAYLFDADGDGRADSMRVYVRGALNAVQAELNWSTAAGAADLRTWNVSPSVGPFGVHPADAQKWFEKSATSCASGCTVKFLDVQGRPLVEWPLIDSVAPMAVRGKYVFGETVDTLSVSFSEALAGVNRNLSWLEWGNTAVGGSIVHTSVGPDGKNMVFQIQGANGAVEGWDSLRLAVGAKAGFVTDALGKKVGSASPWAPIEYGIAPFTSYLLDPAGEGRGTHARVSLSRAVPKAAVSSIQSFVFSWTNESGTGTEDRTSAVSTLSWDGISSWTGALNAPFALGKTGCVAGCATVAASLDGSLRGGLLNDSVPPSATWAKFRYSLPEVALDTLILGLSEPWIGEQAGNNTTPFATVGRIASQQDVSNFHSWSLLDPTTLVVVVPASFQANLENGDSARLTYSAQGSRIWDAAKNHVGEKSRWVPIEFGLRPPSLALKPYRSMLDNSGTAVGGAGQEPPASYPQIELLIKGSKSDTSYYKLEATGGAAVGAPPVNDLNRTLGVEIKINRPLDGVLIVYDNMGTAVVSVDLTPMKALWKDQEDAEKTIRISWNGTDANHKFVSTGVYLFRAVVKFEDSEGNKAFQNLVWKLGFKRDTK